ncbi:Uncharacterized protein APZ42_015505 [Daphnia magna]|uniref:Uncharacterized protein n=1 Tax=Daphnia magna TaxID=35525 RepID=A0A162PJ50_9CRUS|nr:Uncharacterized protein APZ42_015505 [Daphnia magna]
MYAWPACPSARLCLHDYLVMKSSPKKEEENQKKKKTVRLSPFFFFLPSPACLYKRVTFIFFLYFP